MGAAEEASLQVERRQMWGGDGNTWASKMNSEAVGVFARLLSCPLLTALGKVLSGRGVKREEEEREGNGHKDRHDGVTDRRRRGEMRETEWGLLLQCVRFSLQDEGGGKKIQPISTVLTHPN